MEDFDDVQTFLNKHRCEIIDHIQIQASFDKMRNEGVLTLEDCQEMLVPSLYPTDRARASRLIDVIATKGQRGLNVFLECLDKQYPHIYKTVTGKEPSPRPHVTSPNILTYKPGFGNLLQDLSTQNDKLRKEVSDKIFIIERLTEEKARLESQLKIYVDKLDNYQKVLIKCKQLDNEIGGLKDELLNVFVRLTQTERERDKYKVTSKEKAQALREYEQKFESAMQMLNSHRNNMEKTNSKNEQLAEEKNKLQKELQHVKMEMETVKRQSSLYTSGFGDFGETTNLDSDALIEILKQDKEAALLEYEEVVNKLYDARKEIDQKDMQLDKCLAENKDLKCMVEMVQKDLSATERNYQLMWQEMQRLNRQCTNAIEQRNQAQAEVKVMREESEFTRTQLNEELMRFKKELYGSQPESQQPSESPMLISPAVAGISRKGIFRMSNVSNSSGFSSGRGSFFSDGLDSNEEKRVTLPRMATPALKQRPSLPPKRAEKPLTNGEEVQPIGRHRVKPILHRGPSTDQFLPDPFPESEIPLSPTVVPDDDDDTEEDEVVTTATITRNLFADRPDHFSESLLTHKGSEKKDKKHYEKVDFVLTQMRESFKQRCKPKIGHFPVDFTLDYDDESKELARIIGKDPSTVTPAKEEIMPEKSKPPTAPKPQTSSKKSSDKPPVRMQPKTQDEDGRSKTLLQHTSSEIISNGPGVPPKPVKSWHEDQSKLTVNRNRLGARRSIPDGELGAQIKKLSI